MIKNLFSSFLTAALLTFLIIPSLIKVAKVKKLFDDPNSRSSHKKAIPTLGGVAFYVSLIFTTTFWSDFGGESILKYVISALTVVSFIGLKDDILDLAPFNKLMGQIFAAMVLVIWGDIRITSLYNIFGVGELPYIISIIFSIFTILVILNAFNLIDGINGLASSVAIIASLTFGIWFTIIDTHLELAFLAFALIGSLCSFLRYNLTPVQIFMGDTGALIIGLILSVLAIEFIEIGNGNQQEYILIAFPALAMSIISYPLFDLLRSFIIRICKKKSPFQPDKNHIHHLLLRNGLSHTTSTLLIVLLNILVISLSLSLSHIGNYKIGFIVISIYLLFTLFFWIRLKRRKL